jgi:hypothetical protein
VILAGTSTQINFIKQTSNVMLTEYDCNVVGRDQINLCYALTIESVEDNGYANY